MTYLIIGLMVYIYDALVHPTICLIIMRLRKIKHTQDELKLMSDLREWKKAVPVLQRIAYKLFGISLVVLLWPLHILRYVFQFYLAFTRKPNLGS